MLTKNISISSSKVRIFIDICGLGNPGIWDWPDQKILGFLLDDWFPGNFDFSCVIKEEEKKNRK